MKRIWNLAVAVWVALMLASCGGGSGGGSPGAGGSTQAFASLSPSPLTANVQTGTSATLTVRATLLIDPATIQGLIYVAVVDSQKVLTSEISIAQIDTVTFATTVHTSGALAPGRYAGSFNILFCKDVNCAAQYAGSPILLPYDFTVTEAPLSAYATAPTTATVHMGGQSPTPVDILVSGVVGSWTAKTSASWMSVGPSGGTGRGTVRVSFSTATLAVGKYADTLNIQSTDGQTVGIKFDLTVIPTQFVLTSGVPSFTAVNGTTIPSQNVGFTLDNQVPAAWTAVSSAPWLVASPLSGVTPAVMALQPDPRVGPLASGKYSADIVLSSKGVANQTITSALQLTRPELSANVSTVTLGGPKGRDLVTGQSIALNLNTGSNKWPLSVSQAPPWASAQLSAGTVDQNGVSLNVSPNAAVLSKGTQSATLQVKSQVNGDAVSLPLVVNVNVDQRRLLASEWGIGFASTPLGNVLSRTVKITDNFGGSLNWTASSDQAWLTVTGSGVTDSGGGLVVTANPAAMQDGSINYATVTVATNVTDVAPAKIAVAIWKSSAALTGSLTLQQQYFNIVADKIRPYVYAHNRGASIDVFNAHSGSKIGTIANVGAALGAMSVAPNGAYLYALDTANRTMAVVNLATMMLESNWALDSAVSQATPVLAIRTNGVDIVLAGNSAYRGGRSLGTSAGISSGSLTASSDGTKVFVQDSGYSPAGVSAYEVDYSEIGGGTLFVRSVASAGFINGASNGQDIAVSSDGTQLYTASGAPYRCSRVSPTDLSFIGSLPGGDAYPNNVEVTRDGRAICGIAGYYSAADIWVHSANGALIASYRVAGYAKTLLAGQMVVTPDGMVLTVLTDDPLMAFVPIGI